MSTEKFPPGFRADVLHRQDRVVRVEGHFPWDRRNPPRTPANKSFHPKRVVTNFKVRDQKGDPAPADELMTVKMKVPYTPTDVAAAGDDKTKLKLGVWLTDPEGWTVYSWHELEDLNQGNPTTGVVEVQIQGKLADPPVAWGS